MQALQSLKSTLMERNHRLLQIVLIRLSRAIENGELPSLPYYQDYSRIKFSVDAERNDLNLSEEEVHAFAAEFPEGVDIWIHETPLKQLTEESSKSQLPIVEEYAAHRLAVVLAGVEQTLHAHPDTLVRVKQLTVAVEKRIQQCSEQHRQAGLETKAMMDSFTFKSEAIQSLLDKYQQDVILLCTQALSPEDLPRALKTTLKIQQENEVTHIAPMNRRDLISIEVSSFKSLSVNDCSGTLEIEKRHYHNGKVTVNAHARDVSTVANYALVQFGKFKYSGLGLQLTSTLLFQRHGSPAPVGEYYASTTSDPMTRRQKTRQNMLHVLGEDAHLKSLGQTPDPGRIDHWHAHLITPRGITAKHGGKGYSAPQRKLFNDSFLAAMSLRDVEVGEHRATYHYCCYGINKYRHDQKNSTTVIAANQVALLDLANCVLPLEFGQPEFQEPLETFKEDVQQLAQSARAYFEDPEHALKHKKSFNAQKSVVKRSSTELINLLTEKVNTSAFKANIELAKHENRHVDYYLLQSIRLILNLHRGNGKLDWSHPKCNGLLQALIPVVVDLLRVKQNDDCYFSSFGCKSNNDRALLVAILLSRINHIINKQGELTLEILQKTHKMNRYKHPQSMAIYHCVKDNGAPPTLYAPEGMRIHNMKSLLGFTTFASHKAHKRYEAKTSPNFSLEDQDLHAITEEQLHRLKSPKFWHKRRVEAFQIAMRIVQTPEEQWSVIQHQLSRYPQERHRLCSLPRYDYGEIGGESVLALLNLPFKRDVKVWMDGYYQYLLKLEALLTPAQPLASGKSL